ncbi:hypothetical protein B0J17DRAFT_641247 [Rhizoctonia solani]|nr:hypothetical protein B0J17DRAFT_641247 [Rhizoctonia solani]
MSRAILRYVPYENAGVSSVTDFSTAVCGLLFGDLRGLGLLLLLHTLGMHLRVLDNRTESGLDLADECLGATARSLCSRGVGASTSRAYATSGVSTSGGITTHSMRVSSGGAGRTGIASRLLFVTSEVTWGRTYSTAGNRVSAGRRVGAGLVAGHRVVGVGNAVASHRVVSVVSMGARCDTSAGMSTSVSPGVASGIWASSTGIASRLLLMATKVASRVGSCRRVRSGLVARHRVMSVCDTIAGQRIMCVVGVCARSKTTPSVSAGMDPGVRSSMHTGVVSIAGWLLLVTTEIIITYHATGHRIVGIGDSITSQGVASVMGVGAGCDASASASNTGVVSLSRLLFVATKIAVLLNRVGSGRRVRAGLVTGKGVVSVGDTVAGKGVVGVMGIGRGISRPSGWDGIAHVVGVVGVHVDEVEYSKWCVNCGS